MHILIVEDNAQVMATLCDYLSLHSHTFDCAYNGEHALELLRQQAFEVVIMDITMPRLDGISAVKAIRSELALNTPILFLTARDAIQDKEAAFGAGGDDYLVKPFSLRELVLRLDALVSRGQRATSKNLQVGELSYDLYSHKVYRQGNALKLTKKQTQIVHLLMRQHPKPVTKAQILQTLWGDEEPESDALRSHMYMLRNAIDKPYEHKMLVTEYGQGYRLDAG